MAIRWKVGKEPMIPQPEQQALPYCVKLAIRLTVYKNSTSDADGSIDCSVLATISSHACGLVASAGYENENKLPEKPSALCVI